MDTTVHLKNQLVSKQGYGRMAPGVVYHLIRNDSTTQRVLLVRFYDKGGQNGLRSELIPMTRTDFVNGLCPDGSEPPAIEQAPEPATLPPWLNDLSGFQFDKLPGFGCRAPGQEKCAKDEIDGRLLQLKAALDDTQRILQADDPDFALNRHARKQSPKVNETRYRLWFYLYLAFGYNCWSLLPPRSKWGKWPRHDPKHAGKLWGAPATTDEGRLFAYATTEAMIERIVQGAKKYIKPSRTITSAWMMTLRKIFGASIKRDRSDGSYVVSNPRGLPLPSFNKFYRHARKAIGEDEWRRIVMGDKRVGMDEQPVGKQQHWMLHNIGERGHFDATHIKDLPISLLTGKPLPGLQMVVLVDATTGNREGIGFSIGKEESRAYRLALFCAAIPKKKFGEIIGIEIKPEDWDSIGLPASLFTDRGCGSAKELQVAVCKWSINVAMPPSYTPPANSTVEAKHGRRKHQKGAPTHVVSNLTVPEILKRETILVIKRNHSDSALGRASEGAVIVGAVTPAGYRTYLDKRHCSSLIQIPFEDAVRTFLDKVTFTVRDGRLYYQNRLYWSDEVVDSGLAQAMATGGDMKLDGYMYQPATRLGWLEFKGRLIEVKAQARPDVRLEGISIPEVDELAAAYSRASGKIQRAKQLEEGVAQGAFHDETGKEMVAGTTRTGRPKNKTDRAKDEAKRLMSTT